MTIPPRRLPFTPPIDELHTDRPFAEIRQQREVATAPLNNSGRARASPVDARTSNRIDGLMYREVISINSTPGDA